MTASKRTKAKEEPETIEFPKRTGIKIRPMPNVTEGAVFGLSWRVDVPKRVNGEKRILKQKG